MPLNGHYTGRLKRDMDVLLKKAKGRGGVFYSIFNQYGFYDVSDPNNGLSEAQRQQVPLQNQNRFTQMSNAVADMIMYILADPSIGILTETTQTIIDKLDARGAANASQLSAVGNSFAATAAVPVIGQYLAGTSGAMKSAESITTASMGTNPYDPDLIPPFTIGMPGLPAGVANVFKAGFFQPNYDFLFSYENTKNPGFYLDENSSPRIGANIDLTAGGNNNDLYLKKVFGVVSVTESLFPQGDIMGGVTATGYKTIIAVANNTLPITSIEASNFKLNEIQIRNTYYRYVQLRLWEVVGNPENWAYNNWGSLTSNTLPEAVKTAVCSLVWSEGLAVQQSLNPTIGYISYCLQMGIYYAIGYEGPVNMRFIDGVDQIINEDDAPVGGADAIAFLKENNGIAVFGVTKDEAISKKYWIWIAHLLSRMTQGASGSDFSIETRKRRIAEANLIYTEFSYPLIEYGQSVSSLPPQQTVEGLRLDGFNKLVNTPSVPRYENQTYKDAVKTNNTQPSTPAKTSKAATKNGKPTKAATKQDAMQAGPQKIAYDSPSIKAQIAKSGYITDWENWLKSVMREAGMTLITITSAFRNSTEQATAMFDNLQKNIKVSYATAGQKVTQVYYDEKLILGYAKTAPVTNKTDQDLIKDKMEREIARQGPRNVSLHASNPSQAITVDISNNPSKIQPYKNYPTFQKLLKDSLARKEQIQVFKPGEKKEVVLHISTKAPTVANSPIGKSNAVPPAIAANSDIKLTDPTIKHKDSMNAPLSQDNIQAKNKAAGK